MFKQPTWNGFKGGIIIGVPSLVAPSNEGAVRKEKKINNTSISLSFRWTSAGLAWRGRYVLIQFRWIYSEASRREGTDRPDLLSRPGCCWPEFIVGDPCQLNLPRCSRVPTEYSRGAALQKRRYICRIRFSLDVPSTPIPPPPMLRQPDSSIYRGTRSVRRRHTADCEFRKTPPIMGRVVPTCLLSL